jgi:hypothetical protein
MRRSRRLDRKLHERALGLGVIDASQSAVWRRALAAVGMDVELPIDAHHLEGLSASTQRRIRRYGLRYTVARVTTAPARFAELGGEGCVWFRFRALRHPSVVSYTANSL